MHLVHPNKVRGTVERLVQMLIICQANEDSQGLINFQLTQKKNELMSISNGSFISV